MHRNTSSSGRRGRRGFTLIELLVVISIIGLLIGILIPSMNAIRTRAKVVDTQARFASIETGLEAYRGERGLDATYPPSRSDFMDNGVPKIANPLSTTASGNPATEISGAHLLTFALMGADLLGPPGFKDFDRDGRWADDTHRGVGGAYERVPVAGATDPTDLGAPVKPRYPGGGESGFVDSGMQKKTSTLATLKREAVIVDGIGSTFNEDTGELPLFLDGFGRPILYYRANPAARVMIDALGNTPGVYTQQDNALITGSTGGMGARAGLSFGGKPNERGNLHELISVTPIPPVVPPATGDNPILTDNQYLDSFARFIFDPDVKAVNNPVRKDSFLLISAGKDAIYGTKDDVTNWTRK
jgi:prepilin-type N-terminal cleavage/methylation domain-containing protein